MAEQRLAECTAIARRRMDEARLLMLLREAGPGAHGD